MQRPIHFRELDPKVDKSIQQVFARFGMAMSSQKGIIRPEEWRAISPYYGMPWFRRPRNLVIMLGYLALAFFSTIAVAFACNLLGLANDTTVNLLLGWTIMAAVGWLFVARSTASAIQPGTLSLMIPFVQYDTENDRIYAEAVASIIDNPALTPEMQRPMIQALNAVLARIRELEARLVEISRGPLTTDLDEDRLRLQNLLASTTDSVAAGEYRRAIEKLELRLQSAVALQPEQERIQAGLENLRQALLAARDLTQRVRPQDGVALPATSVEEDLNHEVQSVNRAMEEVHQLLNS
ncbi:MAG: hypothetical protein ACOYON_04950 [Fimbriimonas sp.]